MKNNKENCRVLGSQMSAFSLKYHRSQAPISEPGGRKAVPTHKHPSKPWLKRKV